MAILGIQPKSLMVTKQVTTVVSQPASVHLELHDASRIEWKVSLPLCASHYEIEFEVQIPTNAFVKHSAWDHFQSFTRLEGGDRARNADAATIDTLRRAALALAQTLKRKSEDFARICRLAASLFQSQANALDERALYTLIDEVIEEVRAARERLCNGAPDEPTDLARERGLVDEYASVRLLDCLAGYGRALRSVRESRSPLTELHLAAIDQLEARVGEALVTELTRREQLGFVSASGELTTLERYLERASQLKKHFQEVLFLETETIQVAERIQHLVAGFVALLASTWAFFWQIALADQAANAGGKIGSGLLVFAVIAGIVYAAKDRIKEIGRNWISGRVHRHYAQRIAKFRAPKRSLVSGLASGEIIASARESFDQASLKLPDPLNPGSSAKLSATSLLYRQRGQVFSKDALTNDGVTQLKYVFRYDLSPLFSRLDDAVKQVPVLDETTRRVKFVDAPRCYRVPVRVRIRTEADVKTMHANLVLHKRGLERLEFEEMNASPRASNE